MSLENEQIKGVIAALKAENERLRAWIADLRRDSLHADLVTKLAEKDAEIARLKRDVDVLRRFHKEACDDLRWATWEAAAKLVDTNRCRDSFRMAISCGHEPCDYSKAVSTEFRTRAAAQYGDQP